MNQDQLVVFELAINSSPLKSLVVFYFKFLLKLKSDVQLNLKKMEEKSFLNVFF